MWAQLAPSVSPPFLSVSLILPFIPPYLSPPFPFFVLLLHAWNFPFLISSLKHLLPLLTCASLSPPSYFSLSSLSSFFPPQVHHSSIIDIGKFSCKLHEAFFVVLNFHGCIPSAQFFFVTADNYNMDKCQSMLNSWLPTTDYRHFHQAPRVAHKRRYKLMVIPHLDYCACVWNPHQAQGEIELFCFKNCSAEQDSSSATKTLEPSRNKIIDTQSCIPLSIIYWRL